MTEPLLLVGAGGHARACIDVIEQEGRFKIVGILGVSAEVGTQVLGYPVVGTDSDLPALRASASHALVTVGQIKSAAVRVKVFETLRNLAYALPVVVSPRAYVSRHANVGAGTIVMHGAVVNAGATVGENCILNTQSLVEHDVVIGDHCHVATSAAVNGGVRIGSETFVGSGAAIRQGITVGARCIIGMGYSVLRDCAPDTTLASAGRSP